LGTPALDLLREPQPDFYVLELSSFQLETVSSLNAVAAVVLNVSEDHMDRYSDIQQYSNAKARVYDGNGTMIINLDDPLVVAMQRSDRKVIGFTLSEPAGENYGVRVYNNERWLVVGNHKLLPAGEIRITG